jgi:hypothetical protein
MPVITVIWEAEIRRIVVQDQPWQRLPEIPSQPIAGPSGFRLLSQATWEAEDHWVLKTWTLLGAAGENEVLTIWLIANSSIICTQGCY